MISANQFGSFSSPLVVLAILTSSASAFSGHGRETWPSAGLNEHNTRFQHAERRIGPTNVSSLVKAWELDTTGDVSATPAVGKTRLYFPDAGGSLWAVDRTTGAVAWQKTMADYGLAQGDYARVTPVLAGDKLVFGDQGGRVSAGATVMAVSRWSGELLWKTKVDDHPAAMVTQSAIWDEVSNVVYVGISSNEEGFAAFIPNYPCCSFRGSILALNANTGAVLWRTYMAPEGYSGTAVWGSTPVIDRRRRSLYITTGNNYTVPAAVSACVAAATTPSEQESCIAPEDHFDSILALDLDSGAVRWSRRALPFDAWVVSCLPAFSSAGNCPEPAGPDYDFAQGPALFTIELPDHGRGRHHRHREVLGAGQKSGQYWLVDPDDGSLIWVTQTGPGGAAGGLQWGSATDGRRIFTSNSNSDHKLWNLVQNGVESGVTVNGGMWSALDATTGRILWQVANPYPDPLLASAGMTAGSNAPVTLANGVVFGCSLDPDGHMLAMDAVTGGILWDFSSPDSGSCGAGPAIVDGMVYWGSGYAGPVGISGKNRMRAFRLP